VGQAHGPVGVGRAGRAAGQQHAEAHPGEQGRARRHVEPDRAGQAATEGPADPGRQRGRVRRHHGADQPGATGEQDRPAGVDAAEDGQHAEVERQRPGGGSPLARAGDAQQRGGEVLAPDDDGVGRRPQQHQVQRQPGPAGHPVAKGEGRSGGRQVAEHQAGHQDLASGPPATPWPVRPHRRGLDAPRAASLSPTR